MGDVRAEIKADYEEYKAAGRVWGQIDPSRIAKIKFPRIPPKTIEEYLKIKDMTSTVSDIMDSIGLRGVVSSTWVKPVLQNKKIAGTAVTLRNIPERKQVYHEHQCNGLMRMTTRDVQYLSEPGDVLVIDNGGVPDISNAGGQTCGVTKHRGITATIINGGVRDIETIKELDHPVWSRGVTPITGKYRVEAIEINGPVTLYDIQVQPGDLILADDCGICVIPPEYVDLILKEAQKIEKIEKQSETALFSGADMDVIKKIHMERYSGK